MCPLFFLTENSKKKIIQFKAESRLEEKLQPEVNIVTTVSQAEQRGIVLVAILLLWKDTITKAALIKENI